MKLTIEDLNYINHQMSQLEKSSRDGIKQTLYEQGELRFELPSQFEIKRPLLRDETHEYSALKIAVSRIYLDENFEVQIELNKGGN